MKWKHEDEDWGWGVVQWIAGLCLGVSMLALMFGCSPTRYVPVETVRTEWRDREVERVSTDTVLDTRVVFIKGDTVIGYRDRERIRRVEIHDTCLIERTDTVQVINPVERQLSRWERTKMDYGGEAITALVVILIAAVVWLIKKFRK